MVRLPLSFVNILSFLVNTVITYGVGALGWFGARENSQVSALYPSLLTPVGWAFAIWAVIFIVQGVWAIAQQLDAYKDLPEVIVVGYNYLYVAVLQCLWTIAFGHELIWLATIIIIGILYFLYRIVLDLQGCTGGYMLWRFPFSLHLGWILAATAVSVNVFLVAEGFGAGVQFITALVSLSILLLIGIGFLLEAVTDATLPLVLIWALAGVAVQLSAPPSAISKRFTEKQILITECLAILAASALAIGTVAKVIQDRRRWQFETPSESAALNV